MEAQDTQDTVLNDIMTHSTHSTHSLDDYYCDDYDDTGYIKPEDLIKCGNCGNVWDGYAQCNCYQLECYRIYDEQEQVQDLENPAHKDSEQDLENPARKFSDHDLNNFENTNPDINSKN
jgi:hypothetical protein